MPAILGLNALVVVPAHGYNLLAKAGTVFKQFPPSTEQIFPGKTVTITWSDGPPPVQVPDLHGLSCAAAKAQLAQDHLRSAANCLQDFNSAPVGHVISTVPRTGVTLAQGSIVTIHVSKGPQLVKVPDVRGLRVADAIKTLQDLFFQVIVPNYNSKGHVFDQSPAGGKSIPKGSTVTLTL